MEYEEDDDGTRGVFQPTITLFCHEKDRGISIKNLGVQLLLEVGNSLLLTACIAEQNRRNYVYGKIIKNCMYRLINLLN